MLKRCIRVCRIRDFKPLPTVKGLTIWKVQQDFFSLYDAGEVLKCFVYVKENPCCLSRTRNLYILPFRDSLFYHLAWGFWPIKNVHYGSHLWNLESIAHLSLAKYSIHTYVICLCMRMALFFHYGGSKCILNSCYIKMRKGCHKLWIP